LAIATGAPAPPFHESYWVAIAAAAPIVALANQITLTEELRTGAFFRRVLGTSNLPDAIRPIAERGQRDISFAYWIGGINMVVQVLALVAAFASLSGRHDAAPMLLVGIAVAAGLAAIVFTSGFSARGGDARAQLELEDWKPSTSKRVAAAPRIPKKR
jgi:hypothetical protein